MDQAMTTFSIEREKILRVFKVAEGKKFEKSWNGSVAGKSYHVEKWWALQTWIKSKQRLESKNSSLSLFTPLQFACVFNFAPWFRIVFENIKNK